MPNGHGGLPRFGAPVLLGIVTALLLWWFSATAAIIPQILMYLSAVLCGWRLAFHLTMWDAMQYGGAYTEGADMRRARRNYRIAVAILVPLVCLVAFALVP